MTDNPAFDQIKQDTSENDVVLYMKGSPDFPQCGFSAVSVEILKRLGVDYKGVDVLADQNIREGIKAYSDWPTIPQLYVKGEFVGGCDIIREMFQDGELQDLLSQKGITHNAQTQTA